MVRGAKAREAAESARRRLAQRRRRERRRRAAWVSAVAVAVLLAAGLAGVVAYQASRPADAEVPAAATEDGTGLPVGTGSVTVEIYLDLLCPACRQFEVAARPVLDGYLADGTVTVVYRPIAILDDRTSTEYSTRAGAAAGCAADAGAVAEFVPAMLDRQPAEGSAGLSDDQIVQIGTAAGATSPEFASCVREGTYHDWMARNTDDAFDRGVQGTPMVFVDGEQLEPGGVGDLTAAIEAAAG